MTNRRRYGTGSVTQLAPGKWKVRAPANQGGVRRTVSCTVNGTKKEAEAVLRQLLREIAAGRDLDGARKPFGEHLDEWVKIKARDLSPATVHNWQHYIRNRIGPALGHIPVARLTARDIDRFMSASLAGGLAHGTVRQMHGVIRSALTQAQKWGYVETNVAKLASPPPSNTPEMRTPTATELRTLITAAEENDPALATFIFLAATTGARRGELCGLRWGDLTFAGHSDGTMMVKPESALHSKPGGTHGSPAIRPRSGERSDRWSVPRAVDGTPPSLAPLTATLSISRAVGKVGKGPLYVRKPKTRQSVRRIALDPASVVVLERHRTHMAANARAAGREVEPDGYIFSNDGGATPWVPNTVTRKFSRLRDRLGLGHLHLHTERHMVATHLLASGMDVRTVAGRLGHADAHQTLRTYAHVLEAVDRRAADIMGRFVGPLVELDQPEEEE